MALKIFKKLEKRAYIYNHTESLTTVTMFYFSGYCLIWKHHHFSTLKGIPGILPRTDNRKHTNYETLQMTRV